MSYYNLASSISLALTLIDMCIGLFWVMFRSDNDVIKSASKKTIYKNNGTQIAYLIAIVVGSVPWTLLFSFFIKFYGKAASGMFMDNGISVSVSSVLISSIIAVVPIALFSYVFYYFIRYCGAESHCTKDIKFLRAHHMHINNH